MSKSVKRLAANAVLIALFFGLSMLSFEIGGIKITFASLPTVIGAMLFGPVDGFCIGFLGAFLEQLLKYGLTTTTLLWVLPPAIRGLFIGICARMLRKRLAPQEIYKKKSPVYFGVCLVSGMIVSCLNTLVYYFDAVIYHYYSYALIFGVFWIRLASGIASSVLMSLVALPIIAALDRGGFVPKRR